MNEIIQILDDVKSSITGELGIGGSLAQRFLAPNLPSLKEKLIDESDLDLLLLPIENACEVTPSIKDKFIIVEISPLDDNYYFGLIHKATNRWVDLFPKVNKDCLVSIEIGGIKYLADGIENQATYLTRDILRRSSHNLPVRIKWIKKLKELYTYPSLNKSILKVSELEIQNALNTSPSSRIKDKLSTMRQLFKNKTITPSGLSAQPIQFYLK